MIYDKENFTAEKHEKAMEIYIKKLFGGGKELARPGPKSAAQTPAPHCLSVTAHLRFFLVECECYYCVKYFELLTWVEALS